MAELEFRTMNREEVNNLPQVTLAVVTAVSGYVADDMLFDPDDPSTHEEAIVLNLVVEPITGEGAVILPLAFPPDLAGIIGLDVSAFSATEEETDNDEAE